MRQTSVTINGRQTVAMSRRLLMQRTRSFNTDDISSVQIKAGMTSGERVFYKIQLTPRSGKSMTVAGDIASKPESEWLIQEMNHALGRAM